MEKSLFEGAKFGDKFNLYNNRLGVLIYVLDKHAIIVSDLGGQFIVNLDGTYTKNPELQIVVSKYQEPIDEEKLDDLAEKYALGESDYCGEQLVIKDAYKAGYRDRAMEEK